MDAHLTEETPLSRPASPAKRALRGEYGGSPDRPISHIARGSDGDSVAAARAQQHSCTATSSVEEGYVQAPPKMRVSVRIFMICQAAHVYDVFISAEM